MRSRKLIIAGALLLVSGLLARVAWVTIREPVSVVLMILAAVLFLWGVFVFAANFRE